MFDIYFLDSDPEPQDDGWLALRGEIVLGEYREEFLANLDLWDRARCEHHWIQAARRITSGLNDRTTFFTSAFWDSWPMWQLDNETLAVHERFIVEEGPLPLLDPEAPYRGIGDYCATTEDGVKISEWRVGMSDLHDFVSRRCSTYEAA